jgi:hypothetical protein
MPAFLFSVFLGMVAYRNERGFPGESGCTPHPKPLPQGEGAGFTLLLRTSQGCGFVDVGTYAWPCPFNLRAARLRCPQTQMFDERIEVLVAVQKQVTIPDTAGCNNRIDRLAHRYAERP